MSGEFFLSDYHPLKIDEMEDGSGVYIERRPIKPGDVTRSLPVGENVTLDMDEHDVLIGVEITAIPKYVDIETGKRVH